MNNTQLFSASSTRSFSVLLKGTLATLLMMFFIAETWAVEPHTPGSQLYVIAQSGLHLRTSPDVHANSVKVIDHGEQVLVLDQPDSLGSQRVDWVTGSWILVEHEGDEGYIFDGFLSMLNVPTYEWEKCQLDLDMIYPLEQWAEVNHFLARTDTSEGTFITKVTDRYTNGDKLVKINSGDIYKVEMYLKDIRIMDAYHLLQNMLDDKPRVRTFHNESIFIEANDSAELQRIKVKLDNPVDIRKLTDGTIKISIYSQEYPCQL